MKKLSIKENLVWNAVGSLFYQGCQWLTTVLVVLLMPSFEGSGILAFAMATGNVFNVIATYNMRSFQVSDVDNQYSAGNYVGFRIATCGFAWLICLVYSFATSPTIQTLVVVIAFMLFKTDEAFAVVLYGIDQKASRMDFIGVSQFIRGAVTLFTFGGMLYLTSSLLFAVLSMFAGCFLVTLLFDIPHSGKLDKIRPALTSATCFQLAKQCFPIVVSPLLYCLVTVFARQWFGIRFGEEALGVYAAVATPCVLVQALASYLYAPFLTPLAEKWYGDRLSGFPTLLKKAFGAVIAAVVVCIISALLFGQPVVELIYGNRVSDDSWLIVPAMVATSIMAICLFFTDLFIVVRKLNYAVLINAVALIICVVSMNTLFDLMYSNGINIALIASFGAATLLGAFLLGRLLRQALKPQPET